MNNKSEKKKLLKGKVRIKEITPASMRCAVGPCPAIFQTNKGTFIIIGRILDEEQAKGFLEGKVGADEAAVEIRKELITKLFGKPAK